MERFFGVGIVNIIMLWLVFVFLTVGSKAIVNKYNVPEGLKNIINTM
jgi:hypothetical protein